ncbi:MAG: M23 family metallopeptidase [Chloroflexi bacterium]|nr:M23 family metallopeptidase [Chloroflexota bacterium]
MPNADTDVTVKSIDSGIVVGLGHGNNTQNTHAVWGSTNLDDGSPGWCVIVRYRHLYVLYGHLASISNNVWVGASVSTGQQIGTLGKAGDRHLHIEVHSYGATVSAGIGSDNAANVAPNGIMKVGISANALVPPHVYDILQFLPNPPGYDPALNNGLTLRDLVSTSNPGFTREGDLETIQINFGSSCILTYKTIHPDASDIVEEIEVAGYKYRGFLTDLEVVTTLVSPLIQTQQPTG